MKLKRSWRNLVALAAMVAFATAGQADGGPAALKAQLAALQPALAQNVFGRPLHVESNEASDALKSDVHAIVEHPFAMVAQALTSPGSWCSILILPFNIKQCLVPPDGSLIVRIGRKFDQPVDDTYEVHFVFRGIRQTADHLEVQLYAADGPLGTHDHRITVEAIPIDAQRSFIHLSYAHGYGMAARVAMQAYLATVGSNKVGFSVSGRTAKGEPVYVGGVRGVIERNAMRYFLAIDAFLNAPDDTDRRILGWFTASERYPRQLHEMEQAAYIGMKRREIDRQEKTGRGA